MSSTTGQSTLEGYVPPGAEARVPFSDLSRPLNCTANAPPSSNNTDDGDVEVITWVQLLIREIVLLLIAVLTQLSGCIEYLETSVLEIQTAPKAAAPTVPTPATASAAKSPSAPIKTKSKRCDTCHATSHSSADCETADPATMRKQVARNNRIAKERRRNAIQYLPPPIPPTSSPFPQAASFSTTQPPMDYAKLSADATEFRRRQAQSARDKRQAKRRPPSTNT